MVLVLRPRVQTRTVNQPQAVPLGAACVGDLHVSFPGERGVETDSGSAARGPRFTENCQTTDQIYPFVLTVTGQGSHRTAHMTRQYQTRSLSRLSRQMPWQLLPLMGERYCEVLLCNSLSRREIVNSQGNCDISGSAAEPR